MKAYKITILVVDHGGLGAAGIDLEIESVRYPNDCIAPRVMSIEEADIGQWHDRHPLNLTTRCRAEFDRLFAPSTTEKP